MTTAYYSTVLNHPLETVWTLIRDFNNYPAYIDGVTESVIEDDKGGDEVGAVRRFCYLGNWIRQRLAGHSDEAHSLTYAGIEPFPFPPGLFRMRPRRRAMRGRCTCCRRRGQPDLHRMEGAARYRPQDADRWQTLFQSWIPDWTHLERRSAGALNRRGRYCGRSSSSFGRAPPKILAPSGVSGFRHEATPHDDASDERRRSASRRCEQATDPARGTSCSTISFCDLEAELEALRQSVGLDAAA